MTRPGEACQFGDHGEFLRGEMDLLCAAGHPAIEQIECHAASGEAGASAIGADPSAQRGADPGEHFLGIERLGDVIVGAEIERGDFLLGGVARRDDQQCGTGSLDQRHQLEPVAIGQAEIEQHRIRLVDR
jgi:hypothetical protein